jgi:hypothetical protein
VIIDQYEEPSRLKNRWPVKPGHQSVVKERRVLSGKEARTKPVFQRSFVHFLILPSFSRRSFAAGPEEAGF